MYSCVLQAYRRDIIFHNPSTHYEYKKVKQTKDKQRGNIKGLSPSSRRRAVFVANNTYGMCSQFLCTYHSIPTDGEEVKKDWNRFLTSIRKKYKNLKYFWFMEFQNRGSVHFHIFLNIEATKENRLQLSKSWVAASKQKDDKLVMLFHNHPNNFFKWDLSGGYVGKYVSKIKQKDVPEWYKGVGRFWGASRKIAPVVMEDRISPKVLRVAKKIYEKRYLKQKLEYKKYKQIKRSRKFILDMTDYQLKKILYFYNQPDITVTITGARFAKLKKTKTGEKQNGRKRAITKTRNVRCWPSNAEQ